MLSEDQAIEKLKKIRQDTINANECGLANNDFKEEIEVYDMVLNIIDRLRKENEDIQNKKEHQELRFKKYKEDMEKQHEEIYEVLVSEKEEYQKLYEKALDDVVKSQKENEEKDKIIYEIARSNVELKGYEIKEEYINNTINFFTKYTKNLERNPHWRKKGK